MKKLALALSLATIVASVSFAGNEKDKKSCSKSDKKSCCSKTKSASCDKKSEEAPKTTEQK
ncbi:MAG: hypothetical protein EAZ06_00990 [Cytophagales bacterium]|nr:MAG: hypothetical protein EAZ27_07040 [Cytophagales bacterium]TAH31118.1 MAG: hypothetical protein EAZ06_00990 [Cytophagales bacterium]